MRLTACKNERDAKKRDPPVCSIPFCGGPRGRILLKTHKKNFWRTQVKWGELYKGVQKVYKVPKIKGAKIKGVQNLRDEGIYPLPSQVSPSAESM